jgi:hypothetical protein
MQIPGPVPFRQEAEAGSNVFCALLANRPGDLPKAGRDKQQLQGFTAGAWPWGHAEGPSGARHRRLPWLRLRLRCISSL